MRLWLRLFIAIATLSVASLCGLLWWQQQSFARGFSAYLDGIALEHARTVAARLATDYAREKNWDWLRDDPRGFGGIVEVTPASNHAWSTDAAGFPLHEFVRERSHAHDKVGEGSAGDRPPPPFPRDRDGRFSDGPPPPPPDGKNFGPSDFKDGPPRGGRDGGGPFPQRYDVGSRLTLRDADGRYIAGSRVRSVLADKIAVVVGDQAVGTLTIAALPAPGGDLEQSFARQQWRNGWIAGAIVLLLALGVAYALARWMLGPVHALAAGTRALAAGDYARRVADTGRDELGALARDFNRLASTLEQHRGARQRWGADIAHELRTPLTILRVELQTLIDGIRVPNTPALQSLLAECERLSSLTEDLYQLSLADAGALEYRFETIDAGDLLLDATQHAEHSLRDSGLLLKLDLPDEAIFLRADRLRLAQVLTNLLANSHRYTDAPGRIEITLRAARDQAEILIDDSAPGVAAADMPRLFERLFRTEASRTRERGGAGLGLAICRAIVDAHGGQIEATASPLGGLRVRIEMPLAGARR